MAKTSILTIMIQLAKKGDADRATIKGLAELKQNVGLAMGAFAAFAGVAAAAGKALGMTVKAYQDYAGQVRDLSRLTGTNAEETSRLIQAADDVTISYETLQKALWAASKNGVEVNIESIARLADEYITLAGPTQQAAFLAKNFGKGGAEMAKLLEGGSSAVRGLTDAISDNLILTDRAVQQAREYEIQMDNLNDQWEAAKIGIGQKVVPALTELAWQYNNSNTYHEEFVRLQQEDNNLSFIEIGRMAEKNVKLREYTQGLDSAGLSYRAMAEAAGAAVVGNDDFATSLEALGQKNQSTLDLMLNMQSETDNYNTKNDELKTKLQELTTEQGKYFEGGQKYREIQGKIDETKTSIASLATAHEDAGKRIAFSLLQQYAAVDGLTTKELAGLVTIGERWGIVDTDTARATLNMIRGADDLAEALSDPNAVMQDLVQKADNLGGLSGSVFDFYVNIHTTGSFPNMRGNHSGPGAGQENNSGKDQEFDVDFKAAGGPLGAGWTVVGEQGFELIAPNGWVFSNDTSRDLLAGGITPEFSRMFGGEGPGIVTGSGSTFYQSQHQNRSSRRSSGGSSSGAGVSPVQQEVSAVADVVTPMAEATTAAVQTSAAAQQQAQIEGSQTRATIESTNAELKSELQQLNQLIREQNTTMKRTVVAAVQQAMP